MSRALERQVEQLLARVRDLERQLAGFREDLPSARRGYAEAALATLEAGDTAATPIGNVSSGSQVISAGIATLMEIFDDSGALRFRPIDNAAGTNKAKVNYLNAASSTVQTRTASKDPFPLLRLRDGRWIRFASGSDVEFYAFTLTANLTDTLGATATATAFAANALTGSTSTITVTNTGKYQGYSGAKGVAVKLGTVCWVIEVDQPGDVLVVLNTYPYGGGPPRFAADPRESDAAIKLSSPAPSVVSPYPFGFLHSSVNPASTGLIPNPLNFFGEAGDGALLKWDAINKEYYVAQIFPQRAQRVWAVCDVATTGGLEETVECDPLALGGHGAWPSFPFDAVDKFNVAILASDNHKCFAAWNPDAQEYQLLASQHTATEIKATVYGGFSGTPSTFNVTIAANNGMNGKDYPATGGTPLVVHNVFNWVSGSADAELRIKWDPQEKRWEPAQMEWVCPE